LSNNRSQANKEETKNDTPTDAPQTTTTTNNKKKEHKRSFSLGSRDHKNHLNHKKGSTGGIDNANKLVEDPVKLLGSNYCPRLEDLTILEPLVCKKISHERLTALVFREDCFVAACQEGYVSTWARPGHGVCL